MTKGWLGALGLAGMLLVPSACMAQSGWRYDDGHGRTRNGYRVGYDRGFQDGERRGAHEGRHHERFNFRNDRDYRDADNGYRRQLGPRHVYADGYRRGFEEGYRRAYGHTAQPARRDSNHDDRRDRDRRY